MITDKELERMRGTILRAFSAFLVLGLITAVILTDRSAQRMMAEGEKENKKKLQKEEPAAVKVDKQKLTLAEKEWILKIREEESLKEKETYLLAGIGDNRSIFTNRVDGYTIEVPSQMKVDMRLSNIRAVLESDDLKIEVYRQEINKTDGSSVEGYVSYSNLFLNNWIDHHKEFEGNTRINGRTVSYLQWSRRSLDRIENDRNHYASVEVPLSDREVITFLFKSSSKLDRQSCLDVAGSLELIEKTVEPYVQRIEKTKNTSWDVKTAQAYEQYFGEKNRLQWGIFETDAPVDFTELKKIERNVDFTFPILLYYTGILENRDMHPRLAAALRNAKNEGRILELTLQTVEQTPGKGNMVYDVLDGKYDTYLNNYAKEVADFGEPILFRPGNEMNGDWCVYSSYHTSKDTDIFIAFYRYLHEIFREAGADNVIWIWNPNGKSFPDFKWNDELCYYPGDEYVDVVGMTSYNTGTYYESETWTEFEEMYDPLYQKYIGLYEKPLMITEFASSSVGGSKEAWVADMFRTIEKYERIKVAIWWDGCDWDSEGNVARPYFIDETDGLIRLFRENLARFK